MSASLGISTQRNIRGFSMILMVKFFVLSLILVIMAEMSKLRWHPALNFRLVSTACANRSPTPIAIATYTIWFTRDL
jgi:hypothetical protein